MTMTQTVAACAAEHLSEAGHHVQPEQLDGAA